MAKFKRSIQPGGFRPEQVSERNITELQKYSDRISSALREERDAVISDRNRTAKAMEQNAKIEQKQAALNNKIEQQNIKTQIQEQELLSKKAQQDFDLQNREAQAMFGTLSKISSTAALKFQEIEVKRREEQYNNDLAEMLTLGKNSEKYKAVEAYFLDAQDEEQRNFTELAKAQQRGMNPLDGNRYAKNLSELSLGLKVGYLKLQGDEYAGYLREEAINDENSSLRNYDKAGAFSSQALKTYMDLKGITGINPALLQKSGFLDSVLATNQEFMNTARSYQLADDLQEFTYNFRMGLKNQVDSASASRFIEVQYPEILRRFEGDKTKALDFIENLAKEVELDGRPVFNTEAIFAAALGPEGESFGDYWSKRKTSVYQTLRSASNTAATASANDEKNKADRYVKDVMLPSIRSLLDQARAGEDESIFATAEQEALDEFGFIPKALSDAKAANAQQNKLEATQIATTAEALLATGEPANINKARSLINTLMDPELRKDLVTKYQSATNPIKVSTDSKKAIDKAVTAAARELLGQSLEGSASSKAQEFIGLMTPDVYIQYKEEYTKTRDHELAKQNTLAWLSNQVAEANMDRGRYDVKQGPNNQSYMPYFQNKQKVSEAEREVQKNTIINTVGAIGISILESPGLIPEKELREISLASEQGIALDKVAGSNVFALRKAFETQGKAVSFGEIYNKAIETHNRYNPDKPILPLGISPMLEILNLAHPATIEALSNNPTPAIYRRAVYESGGVDGLRLANTRLGRNSARPNAETAFVNTVRIAEGTAGPDGYNKVYGGAVVPQLTQMTLGELYDAIKLGGTDAIPERLGGGKIPFKKDEYNSSASGAIQIMPDTLLGLINSGRYSPDDLFSPEVQDQMIIDLGRNGGVDIDNMTVQQMEKAGNIWAGLTPRYGQTNRTANESFQEFQRQLNQLN